MTRIKPRVLVTTWNLIKRRALDVFRPGIASILPDLPEWTVLGLPQGGVERELSITLLDALRALALSHRQETAGSKAGVELVATLPEADRTVLATQDVVYTMLESARKTILVAGFELTEPSIRRLLIRKGMDQIAVTVVGDRVRGSARELLKDWPTRARPLRALENIEAATPNQASLQHAKVITTDGESTLIGSANFTAGGLRNNIELGVRVSGALAVEIEQLIARLEKSGWLTPV